MRSLLLPLAVVVVCSFFAPTSVRAQSKNPRQIAALKRSSISLTHRAAGGLSYSVDNAKPVVFAASKDKFYMYPDMRLTFTVTDAAPIVFGYVLKKGPSVQSSSQMAAASFAVTLSKLALALPAAAGGVKQIGKANVGALTTAIQGAHDQVAKFGDYIDLTLGTPEDNAVLATALKNWKTDIVDVISTEYANLTEVNNACLIPGAAIITDLGKMPCDDPNIKPVLDGLARIRVDAAGWAELLSSFSSDVAAITSISLGIEYETTNTSAILEITPNNKYAQFFSAKAKQAQKSFTGTTTFPLEAYSYITIGIGPGIIYSFVKSPTFTAVPKGTQFAVQTTSNDVNAYNVAAMLTFSPAHFVEPNVKPFFQLGAGPEKDHIGLYLGLGAAVANSFSFGVGIAAQQVLRLAPGVGDTIASPDLLKTETHFALGPYLTFTYSVPVAGKQ